MNWFPKHLVLILCLCGWVASLQAEDPRQKRKIDLPVPIGHPVTGLHVPIFNVEGKTELELDTESATRVDPANVQMKTVMIQTFDDKTGKPELQIILKTANLNTETNIVTSQDPIVVTRSDFELTGDSMEFAHDTRQATVKGNVRMLIYNRQASQSRSQQKGQPQ